MKLAVKAKKNKKIASSKAHTNQAWRLFFTIHISFCLFNPAQLYLSGWRKTLKFLRIMK
jgi:hypothetical protein